MLLATTRRSLAAAPLAAALAILLGGSSGGARAEPSRKSAEPVFVEAERQKAEGLARALDGAGASGSAARVRRLRDRFSWALLGERLAAHTSALVAYRLVGERGNRIEATVVRRASGGALSLRSVTLGPSTEQLALLSAAAAREIDEGPIAAGTYQEPLVALRRAIWDPVAPWLDGASAIVVSSAGPLRGAPLHALVTQSDPRVALPRPHFLVEERSFAYVPSAAIWGASEAVSQGPQVVVAPAASSELGGVLAEAQVRRLEGAQLVEGARATRAALRRSLQTAGRLDLIAHGERPSPRLPGRLQLADGLIDPGSLARTTTPATLVVLSGCETGPSPREPSSSRPVPLGFVEALLSAGAGRVLASSSAIRDHEAAAMMSAFAKHRRRGLGLAASLASAQRDRIAALEAPHPRLWSAPALHGGL